MPPLCQHMMTALQLSGTGERPQHASGREVRLLAQFSGKSPDVISDKAVQASCLHRHNLEGLAPASLRIGDRAIRVFSPHVLPRDWHTLTRMRAPSARRLPAVLRVEEVRRLRAAATPLHNPVAFPTVSRLGLRLQEALSLQGSDLDGPRLQVHIHRGQGATDRAVPLPADTRALLRPSWQTPRHTTWLFPATGRDQRQSPTAISPMSRSSVQGACRTATHRAGITTMGVAIPPLRHAYATHRLEAGVKPRRLQRSLGHTQLETTMISLHLTHPGPEDAYERLNALRPGLLP